MIGVKKDDYLLDRKPITKTEVANLLERGAFALNPYNISRRTASTSSP